MFYGCESLNRIENSVAIDIFAHILWGISLCDRRFHIASVDGENLKVVL